MATILRPDPFNAVFLSSPPLVVSGEQVQYIEKVLDKACSDSRFAEKAKVAIRHILAGSVVKPPAITSLTPNSAEVGDPAFLLHVHGTDFKNTDVIVFLGTERATTYVSATELTTNVDPSAVTVPATVPVAVRTTNGIQTDSVNFTFTDGTPVSMLAPPAPAKVHVPAKK